MFVDNRYISPDTWYDAETAKAFQPQVHYFVGGATKLYGAALYRLRERDFGELRHHDGISPAWPIGYDEMEPYYTLAEELYQVHGARGEDPTEPPASGPYPFPAVSHEPRIQQLSDDLEALGHHPFHAPCGVMLNEADMAHGRCVRCSTCDGFPCLVHAKSDAEVLAVRPAMEYPNVTLLTDSRAVALHTNAPGTTVTEVAVERDGATEIITADIVVVSCGAANSAKLLLASATEKHPDGLSNRSDQLGRNYTFHNSQAVLALSKEENPTVFQKTLGLNDFYFGSDDFEYPLGNIQMVGKSQADMFRGEKPLETKLAPTRTLAEVARHAVDFWLSTEDLPRPENRVTLNREGEIRISYTQTNHASAKQLYHELKKLLAHTGMHPDHLIPRHAYLKTDIPVAGVAHQAGTCRFGADPGSSVLNTDCRAHELDNLYVVDTSFFPSIGAVNPGSDRHGERVAGRRPSARPAGRASARRRRRPVPPDARPGARRRVVVVGGGFGGLAAARSLRHADVDVTLVDRRNHHLFQPLLYQAAAGGLSPSDCAAPIRPSLKRSPNTAVLMADVTDVDAENREVVLDRGDRLPYDSLIVACGGETSYFGHDEWKDVTCGLKTLVDVVDLRKRFFGAFEQAERSDDPAERAEWLTFVIVGGGPTGVEIAGQLAITAGTMRRAFRRIDAAAARVIVLDAGDRLVAAFSEKLSARVAKGLAELGVTVHEGARATAIDERGVTYEAAGRSERIDSRTVIWAAGVRPVALVASLAGATGASTDRGGRIAINPDLTVPGHPEISVIGDAASLEGPGGRPLPGLATVAIQQAHHVAKGIRAGGAGASTRFRYLDKGALAVVGKGKAVCEIRGLKLWGRPAFFTYLARTPLLPRRSGGPPPRGADQVGGRPLR